MWSEPRAMKISTRYFPGRNDDITDQLSHFDWFLLPWMLDKICQLYGRPMVNLFAKRRNHSLSIYISFQFQILWNKDAFLYQWYHRDVYIPPPPPPCALICQVINLVMSSSALTMILVLLYGHIGNGFQTCFPLVVLYLLGQLHIKKFHQVLDVIKLQA